MTALNSSVILRLLISWPCRQMSERLRKANFRDGHNSESSVTVSELNSSWNWLWSSHCSLLLSALILHTKYNLVHLYNTHISCRCIFITHCDIWHLISLCTSFASNRTWTVNLAPVSLQLMPLLHDVNKAYLNSNSSNSDVSQYSQTFKVNKTKQKQNTFLN